MNGKILHKAGKSVMLPHILPVTTFGKNYPLDEIIRPHLPFITPMIMASHFYANQIDKKFDYPLFVDSGGFAGLFEGTQFVDMGEYASIRTKDGALITPITVLELQSRIATIGATLDFIIPPGLPESESLYRQDLTIKNALWAIKNSKTENNLLFASLQAWDSMSAERILTSLIEYPFDGFALGGMVPRIRQPKVIFEIVEKLRQLDSNRPLHVFGIGQPTLVKSLLNAGVDSVDSSSYIQYSVEKKYLHPQTGQYMNLDQVGKLQDICDCKICEIFSAIYLGMTGEMNTMALALHNLIAFQSFLSI